jgi:hypothetical protein
MKCPRCGRDPDPPRRASARYEEKNREARNRARREARAAKKGVEPKPDAG